MKEIMKGKRILSLILALLLLLSNISQAAPAFAAGEAAADSAHPDVGKNVKFTTDYPQLWVDKTNPYNKVSSSAAKLPAVLKIVDVYAYSSSTLLYQLDAAEGYSWPENYPLDGFDGKYWIESTKVKILEPCDKCGEYECGKTHENWCNICGKDDCGNDHLTEIVTDSQGEPLKDSNGQPLQVTVAGDLPTGAKLQVSVPTINGEMLPNVFDIKVYAPNEQGQMIEWQPIDEGKTVTVYLPVDDAKVEHVNVYHIIEYSRGIDGGEELIDISLLDNEMVGLLFNAIQAYGDGIHIAQESVAYAQVSRGAVAYTTSSFSVFYYNEEAKEYGTGDADLPTNPANLSGIGDDHGKYYFVNRGDTIYFYGTSTRSVSDSNALTEPTDTGYKTGFLNAYKVFAVTVKPTALFYNQGYKIQSGLRSINIVVMPVLTIVFESSVPGHDIGMEAKTNVFMGNSDQHDPENGKYAAMNEQFAAPAAPNAAYTFSHWYVKHNPAKTFNANEKILLSNSSLEIKMDDTIDSYTVVLVAEFHPSNYTITYQPSGGTLPAGEDASRTYTIEDVLTMPTPTRDDHVFLGWKVTSAAGNWTAGATVSGGSSVQSMYGNVTLTAQWAEISDATYRVEHYLQNTALSTDPSTYQLAYTDTLAGKPGHLTEAAAKGLLGFAAQAVTQVVITEDNQTVVKIYYNRNTYTISFDTNGGTSVEPITQAYGTTVAEPTSPKKTGYVFKGWYVASAPTELYSITTMPAENTKLYAKWEAKKITITIKNVINGEEAGILNSINQDAETALTAPSTPVKAGYIFGGWYKDAACTQAYTFPSKMPTSDLDIYAKWTKITYSVNFLEADGTNVQGMDNNPLEFTVTDSLSVIPVPQKEGYTFEGWYASSDFSGEAYTWQTLVAEMMYVNNTEKVTKNLYAKWSVNSYTITWKDENGNVLGTTQVDYGVRPVFSGTPSKAETAQYTYTFAGWKATNGTVYVELPVVTGDATYQAAFTPVIRTYTVTWKNWDGTVLETDTDVPYGAMPSYNGSEPTKPKDVQYSYVFSHWSTAVVAVAGDAVYTATFTPVDNYYTITWVDGNGAVIGSEEVKYGDVPTYTGAMPQKNATAEYSYTFNGQWSPAIEAVQGDATYTAQFAATKNKYTITWQNWDGTELYSESLEYGKLPSYSGAIPVKNLTGYTCTFTGWSPEVSAVTGNAAYRAQFSQTVNRYTVTFIYGNGAANTVSTLDYGAAITPPAAPTKLGYTFAGWDQAIPANMPAYDLVIQATWTLNTYTIRFDTGCSIVVADQQYPYGAVIMNVGVPAVRPGYAFNGWMCNGVAFTDAQGNILLADGAEAYTMGAEDLVLVAMWSRSLTSLTIQVNGCQGIDGEQGFLFDLVGENGENVTVAVKENGIVVIDGLTIGNTYTVTLHKDWSWRYMIQNGTDIEGTNLSVAQNTITADSVTFTMGENGVLTFKLTRNDDQWLDGNDWLAIP